MNFLAENLPDPPIKLEWLRFKFEFSGKRDFIQQQMVLLQHFNLSGLEMRRLEDNTMQNCDFLLKYYKRGDEIWCYCSEDPPHPGVISGLALVRKGQLIAFTCSHDLNNEQISLNE